MVRKPCLNRVLCAALQKNLLLRHQEVVLLLPHRTAQEIRLTKAEPREHLHNLHDLLLIEHDAKRLLEDRLEQGVHVDDLFFPMQAVDEIRHHPTSERSRTIERNRRDQIDEALRLQVLDEVCHARRLHLKYSSRISITQHL